MKLWVTTEVRCCIERGANSTIKERMEMLVVSRKSETCLFVEAHASTFYGQDHSRLFVAMNALLRVWWWP